MLIAHIIIRQKIAIVCANCIKRSGNYNSISIECVGQNCRGFKWSSFISTTGLFLQENTVKFNEKQTRLTVSNYIPFYDIVNTTIMVTGENKNGEKKGMVTKVLAVMHKNNNTVLKVSNKGLNARGKTALNLVRKPDVPGPNYENHWSNANIAILNNIAFDNNNIKFHTTPFVFEKPALICNKNKNDRTFSLIVTLDDENNRTVMEKDKVIRTMTQKNMLQQIKDGDNTFFKVATMSFNGKAGIALIRKVEVLKNNKYNLELIADRKNFNRLSNNTNINKLTYTSVEKVRTQNAELESVRIMNELCAINSQFFCGGFCTWCGITGGACRYTCAPV